VLEANEVHEDLEHEGLRRVIYPILQDFLARGNRAFHFGRSTLIRVQSQATELAEEFTAVIVSFVEFFALSCHCSQAHLCGVDGVWHLDTRSSSTAEVGLYRYTIIL
jgi:hypothetical protein